MISAFGSMIFCILWKSHKLKSFSAWNQFRAAHNYEKSWSGTILTINFGPNICDLCLWIDALAHSLWMTKIFKKSQIEALWCPYIHTYIVYFPRSQGCPYGLVRWVFVGFFPCWWWFFFLFYWGFFCFFFILLFYSILFYLFLVGLC